MAAGIVMLLAAAALVGRNAWEENQAEKRSTAVTQELKLQIAEARAEQPDSGKINREEPEQEKPETLELDGEAYLGVLSIPALGLELPVMADWSDPNLKRAPCRYVGEAQEKNLVIAGHNYRCHFGALERLPEGSDVILETVGGDVLRYQVTEREVLAPTAIEEMTAGEEPLTLFTCTYGGRSRFTLRCDWAA